jgi:long-subunit acyl-CoA synthetase (AMP-forming)
MWVASRQPARWQSNRGVQTGELLLKGPNVFQGYLNRPELNEDVFTTDGYFRTGDIGYRDAKGNYYITDRAKELIKYSEEQPRPSVTGSAVAESLTIGQMDSRLPLPSSKAR